jgi:hypothetical protein
VAIFQVGGVVIYPTILFEHVDRHGGYDKVNESKLWTAGVQKLFIPFAFDFFCRAYLFFLVFYYIAVPFWPCAEKDSRSRVCLAVARELGIDTKKCTSAAYSLKRFYQQHVNKQVWNMSPFCFCNCSFFLFSRACAHKKSVRPPISYRASTKNLACFASFNIRSMIFATNASACFFPLQPQASPASSNMPAASSSGPGGLSLSHGDDGNGQGCDADVVHSLCMLSEGGEGAESLERRGRGRQPGVALVTTGPKSEQSEGALTPRKSSEDGGDGGGQVEGKSDGRGKKGRRKDMEQKPVQSMSRDERKMLFYMKQFEKMEAKNQPTTPRAASDDGRDFDIMATSAPSQKKRKEIEDAAADAVRQTRAGIDRMVERARAEARAAAESPSARKKARTADDEDGPQTPGAEPETPTVAASGRKPGRGRGQQHSHQASARANGR